MSTESWTNTRRDFERLRELGPAERDRRLRELDSQGAEAAGLLRELLRADETSDPLLDSDAPTLHAAWLSRRGAQDLVGTEVAGYRIVDVLGEGGSATVYRAEGARSVAVKVLKTDASSPGLARRFEQESETLLGLDHPGLIRVLGAGRLDDGRPYLLTEFVAGRPIDAHCERAGLLLPERLRLFVEVCRAVHHAHRHLIVHRDLKPSNILVGEDGRPKVLDFGVAKLLDPARDPAWTEQYGRGPLTPAYASPEQVRGERVTTASDVYSLGVLLFELATGASPYAEAPPQREVLERGSTQREAPERWSTQREALERAVAEGRRIAPELAARSQGKPPPPADVTAILERALAPHPGDRYASAEHLAQDLVAFLEHRPLPSRSEPWTRRAARFARRRPWVVGVAAASVLVLLGSWLGTGISLRRVAASERIAWRAHASAVHSTNLLADLLERIGSSALAGPELSKLVSETEQRLGDLAQHPETEARLRMALARLERARGNPAAARPHLERALELARSTRGLSRDDAERCLRELSELE